MKISLIGYMGSGKSATGRSLSKITGIALLDLDSEIEKRTGKTIVQIFEEDGEKSFRKLETEELTKALESERDQIISCGGGAVIKKENRENLKALSKIVFLSGPIKLLFSRVVDSDEMRPLLRVDRPEEKFSEIFLQRKKYYEKLADITIDIEGKKTVEIAQEICLKLKMKGSNE